MNHFIFFIAIIAGAIANVTKFNEVTLKLFKQFAPQNNGNFGISGYSSYVGISIAQSLSGGETLKEIQDTFQLQGNDEETLEEIYDQLKSTASVHMANGIIAGRNNTFKDALKSEFDDLSHREYDYAQTAQEIQNWIADRTESIRDIPNDINPSNATLYLITAMDIYGNQETLFDQRTAKIQNSRKLISAKGNVTIVDDTFARVPYGDDLFINIINVDSGNMSSNITALTVSQMHAWSNSAASNGTVAIPTFNVSSSFSMKNGLKTLGINSLFQSEAKLPYLTVNTTGLTDALHSFKMDFRESKILPSKVTLESTAPTFESSVQFIFYITDNSDRIIAIGKVENPSSEFGEIISNNCNETCVGENVRCHASECTCKEGYGNWTKDTTNVDGAQYSCTDVNECELDIHRCGSGKCDNNEAGYECTCKEGFDFENLACKKQSDQNALEESQQTGFAYMTIAVGIVLIVAATFLGGYVCRDK